jgi:hypothetical protein
MGVAKTGRERSVPVDWVSFRVGRVESIPGDVKKESVSQKEEEEKIVTLYFA